MFRLPYVPTADGLIDKAFRQGAKEAKKVRSTRKERSVRLKKSEGKRVETIGKIVVADLTAVVKHFPKFGELPVFYQQLLHIKVDKDKYKKSLGAVQWCSNTINILTRKTSKNIQHGRTAAAREFMGRASSIVKQIGLDLDRLIEIKAALRSFPDIKELPTLVIAGYPNVGKSTFMKNLTGAGVRVASYPFTTKDLQLGYKNIRHQKYQIIDLPGLLDRPVEKRNKIEQQAVLAIRELATNMLFIFDPTQNFDPQYSLLKEIEKSFDLTVVVAINKIDVADEKVVRKIGESLSGYSVIEMSAKDPESCDAIFQGIFS